MEDEGRVNPKSLLLPSVSDMHGVNDRQGDDDAERVPLVHTYPERDRRSRPLVSRDGCRPARIP